jgi:hemoglobin
VVTHSVNAYAALGGHPGLRRAVEYFAELVLSDSTVAGHFRVRDPAAWRRHQLELLAAAVGGPQRNSTAGQLVAPGAERLTAAEFHRVLGHLRAALYQAGAHEAAIRDVIEAVAQTPDLIVIAPETTHPQLYLERTQS